MLTPQSWTDPIAPEKKGSLTTSPVHRLTDPWVPTQFLSPHSHWSSRLKTNICWGHATLIYWAHEHQYAIGTFNTYSRVPTPRSLTDTDGGNNLGSASFPHYTPRPSQPTVSTFHLRAPLDLHFHPTLIFKIWVHEHLLQTPMPMSSHR
jgi:hypothetical protein